MGVEFHQKKGEASDILDVNVNKMQSKRCRLKTAKIWPKIINFPSKEILKY